MVRREPLVRAHRAALLLMSAALIAGAPPADAAPLPENDGRVHEGVASCASTVCHGRVNRAEQGPVWRNEYRIWLRQDYHSRAYRTLLSEQSRDIAAKLGLPAAHTAKICLDCHADNVPVERRGRRFQLDDGVGCEACHGGSGEWLASHAETGTSHADNIRRGLYPSEDPAARAKLCLSCHLGTASKLATHRIMGAGHPRLSFELETFGVNQPAHYSVDADYRERKVSPDPVANWLTGLAASSAQLLALLAEDAYRGDGMFPELSFFQCHACHHGMDQLRWKRDPQVSALGPGTVRLNDGPLLVLAAMSELLRPQQGITLLEKTRSLHQASLDSDEALRAIAGDLEALLDELGAAFAAMRFDGAQHSALRRQLLEASAAGRFRYFTAAEQAFLGIETLCIELDEQEALAGGLDALFEALNDETGYLPEQFAFAARRMLEGL